MEQSHQDESVANIALSKRIERVMHGRQIRAESTNILAGKGNAGLKPDIVITAKGRSPVVIEAEYLPANNVEQEARDRFQTPHVEDQIHTIEAVIALRYPDKFEFVKDIDQALAETDQLGHVVAFHRREKLELDPSSHDQPHRYHHYPDGDGNCEVASPQSSGENRLIHAIDKRPQSTDKPSLKPQENSQNRPTRDASTTLPMTQVAGQHQQRLHQRK